MADVFISYASEDRGRVRPLADALQQRGFKVWWDRSLASGQDYTAVIERELKNAKAVIVVWTQSSTNSTFVRDEAGRARDQGRLVPVLLDNVQLPLGFGAFQAEDFTKWNGGSNAPQMQILEEALKAKIEGRDVNSAEIARKRRKLMARVRLVSVLTVIALVIGIAAGGRYLFDPPKTEVTQADLRAELLRLLAEGQLTPEQAIQLAQILEAGALGEVSSTDSAPSPMVAEGPEMRGAVSDGAPVEASLASFQNDASETYRTAFAALSQHSSAEVRLAVAQMSQPETRDAVMQTLWTYAQNNPDDPLRDQIYLLCGSVGEANDSPLGQRALEVAANVATNDPAVWRMLSRSYARTDRCSEARGAALVSEAVQAQSAGDTAAAEQRLQEALPELETPVLRAPVVSNLGQIAERRDDWSSASARYAEAYRLREQSSRQAPARAAERELQADAQQLVIALDRSGRTREACERLRQAQEAHNVAAPDQELLDAARAKPTPGSARVWSLPRNCAKIAPRPSAACAMSSCNSAR
ncbi:MAG: toll/interleukin-1 receptor domain-containing protein [Terricaulis sp.]|nr:toll/interleukin-1 receptor domain-containing protein [Terricaulis sp.]